MRSLPKANFIVAAMLSLGAAAPSRAGSDDIPLPPVRPAELGTARKPEPDPQPPSQSSEATAAETCSAQLRRQGIVFTEAPVPAARDNACQIREAVALVSVPDAGGRSIRFDGAPVIDCSLAKSLAVWTREIAAPVLTQALGSQVTRVRDVGGYECRNRNGDGSGKVSAHAQGLAIDLGAFEMSDGTIVSVVPGRLPRADAAIAAIRQAACGWFFTVLGPGSDPAHATHLHLDVQQHGSSDSYRICQ